MSSEWWKIKIYQQFVTSSGLYDVMIWKRFPYMTGRFVQGIHRPTVDSPHNELVMLSLWYPNQKWRVECIYVTWKDIVYHSSTPVDDDDDDDDDDGCGATAAAADAVVVVVIIKPTIPSRWHSYTGREKRTFAQIKSQQRFTLLMLFHKK